ncbi:nucleotide sugar dehydrogenase [bacterium]|nr:nucleotide sugar dehydrogenase [bacterium]
MKLVDETVSVVGLGYIGLPTAIVAARAGYHVFGCDVSEERVNDIAAGRAIFNEPGMSEELTSALASGMFLASTKIQSAKYFVIAVPTPFFKGKKADLSYVFSAAEAIACVIDKGSTVILESTVPVGTTNKMAMLIARSSGLIAGEDFFVAHCPERVLPGQIFKELRENDRVVGGACANATRNAVSFYKKFVHGKIHATDDRTAEMVKLVENSSRDAQIAFANQVADMADKAGIRPKEVIELANCHPRVSILNPGVGVGGHCIAVDPWFLIESFPHETALLKKVREVNDRRPFQVVNQILAGVRKAKSRPTCDRIPKVAILGLTFKPDADDMRGSPALQITNILNKCSQTLELVVCEPNLSGDDLARFGFAANGLWNAIADADVVAILVAHSQFKQIAAEDLVSKIVVDPVSLLDGVMDKSVVGGATHSAEFGVLPKEQQKTL